MMEAVSKSETSVSIYQIIRCSIPEDIFMFLAVRLEISQSVEFVKVGINTSTGFT
jgi:hypothetical protein